MNSHTGLAIATLVCITCTPNVLNAQQPLKDGTYFCTVEFAAGLAYNQTTKRWQSTTLRPDYSFILGLEFIETKQDELLPGLSVKKSTVSSYNIALIVAGSEAMPCLSEDRDAAVMYDGNPFVRCTSGVKEYSFNFQNNRFLQAYMHGYVDGKDDGGDTPSMSGGMCTRIK